MKTKLPLIASLYFGLCSIGSAFSLDFNLVPINTTVPPTLTINVPGYGSVDFEILAGSAVVDNKYASPPPTTTSPSLNFDTNESVKITFVGAQPEDIDFAFVGVSIGEQFTVTPQASPNEFVVTLANIGAGPGATKAGAGLYQINFIPEPSSSILGVIGASMLLIRRRR